MMSKLAKLRSQIKPIIMRAASTQACGVSAALSKNPEDVVITFAKRTPIGRAKKGQFKDTPVDEILHGLFKVRSQDEFYVHLVIFRPGYFGEDQAGPYKN
jgi:hypothetical protein